MKLCADKQCRRAGKKLRLSEFTKNKNMKDGRGPYCKECFLRRVHKYRTGLRARRAAEKALREARELERKPMQLSPLLKVKSAVEKGKRTREEIRSSTRLSFDDVGDALAELAFLRNELRIVRVGEKREFHLAVDRAAA